MKKIAFGLSLMMCLTSSLSYAQEIPVPAEESPNEAVENSAQENVTSDTESQESEETTASSEDYAAQMIAFFDGLDKTIQGEDCQAISDAMLNYCQAHQAWIESLDYATENLDSQTVQVIHEKATALGKKLSVCYNQKSIPAFLRKYAGLGSL